MKEWAFCLVFIFWHIEKVGSGCTISINNDITEPQPLILKPEGGSGNDAFYLPDNGDTITLLENQLVDLACPKRDLVLNGVSIGSSTGQATCTSGRFLIKEEIMAFSAITCSSIPDHTARFTGNTCLSEYKEIEIGFVVENRFLRHILICFNHTAQNTLYSQILLTKTIQGYQKGYPRSIWLEGSDFYNVSGKRVNALYKRNQQRATINGLLGLHSSSYKYISETNELFLTRGHLTAKADFLYGAQHRLTFYFVNAAPQWQTFNGHNWMYLESDIRSFVTDRGLDLIMYTGTYGVATLPHQTTGEDVELYLYVSGDLRSIPIPRLIWKVLYDPVTKAGVVFIGVNNPYVLSTNDVICTDICNQYPWLTWKASNYTLGYSYCCDIDDFRKTVTTLPNFEVVELLK